VSDKRYYGLYRGICYNNVDPTGHNQIQVSIPDLLGDPKLNPKGVTGWIPGCMPVVDNGTHANHTDTYTTTAATVGQYGSHTHNVTLNSAHSSHISVPNINQVVWIMFEKGDPNFPVWMGVYI